MGYTHYWERTGYPHYSYDLWESNQYAELRMDASRLIAVAIRKGTVVRGPLGSGQPHFTEDYFSLNGDGSAGLDHETFAWWRSTPGNDTTFDFCKTNYKPYDAVVTAVLIRAKEIYGDFVSVRSDGDWDDWASGRKLYEWTFGRKPNDPLRSAQTV